MSSRDGLVEGVTERGLPIGAGVLASLLGVVCAVRPSLALLALVGTLALIGMAAIPLTATPAVVVLGTGAIPTILIIARARGVSVSATPVAGQATLIVFLGIVFGLRARLSGIRIRLAGTGATALLLYAALLVFACLVAEAEGNDYPGILSDVGRQLTYMAAFPLGILAVRVISASSSTIQALLRPLAVAAIAADCSSIGYWIAARTHQLASLPVLRYVEATNAYGVGRSIFPFSQDSPNLAAVIFAMLGAFIAPPLLIGENRDRRLGITVVVLSTAAVLSTESRAGLIALVAVSLPYVFMLPKGPRRRRAIAGLLVGALVVVQVYSLFPSDRRVSNTANVSTRRQIWSQALAKFNERPVLGQGYRFSARDQFLETTNGAVDAPGARLFSIHNDYLEVLVDEGVPGVLVVALLFLVMVRTGLRLLRRGDDEEDGATGAAFLCALVVLGAAMATNAVLQSAAAATVLWLMFGISAGISSRATA